VIVVPDTSGLARIGESAVSSKVSGRGDNSYGDGIGGLKKLGVKEMTYKVLFVASSVQQTDQRSGRAVNADPLQSSFVIPTSESSAEDTESDNPNASLNLSEADKADILRMHNEKYLYHKLVDSFCPSVFGHLEVKRGVLLMLFGGVHKKTPEGISLRGDLNVCIVGDPSCAKSQFLKYVHGFLPRTVYTSGIVCAPAFSVYCTTCLCVLLRAQDIRM
jgi:DNA replication licensing factor MCM6